MLRSSRIVLLVAAALVALVAWIARGLHDQRVSNEPYEPQKGWFSADPDSLYHMRRVERALDDGLPPAETDPRMNYPHGAAIPWPPYYTYVLYAAVAPGAPGDAEARHAYIEQRVASLPRWFAMLASVAVVLVAWRVLRGASSGVRAFGAVFAGLYYALLGASLLYSGVGNGDHHAWVTLLLTLLLGMAAHALDAAGDASSTRRTLTHGAVLGVLAGVMIGSWVGGLVYVALVELAFGLALLGHARRAQPGLPLLGLVFHLVWAATIAPAVLSSPWKQVEPWMLINLSWLHLAHPLLGALVFAPLVVAPRNNSLRRRWPALVSSAFALLCIAVATGDFALARGVREGFAWASRSNEFMAFITESQPLAWGAIGGFGPTMRMLGYGALLAPPVALWLAWTAWKQRRIDLGALAIVLPPLAAQALVQQRFADAFGPVLAIALGVALANWTRALWRDRVELAAFPAMVVALLLQAPTIRALDQRGSTLWSEDDVPGSHDERAKRGLHRWIAAHSDPSTMDSVLASWDQGHAIEWAAHRASIGTNFGSYVGEDSYLDPWRFFLSDDPREAEALLEARRARYVLVTGDFTKDLEVMLRLLRPEERRSYLLIPEKGPVWVSQRFFSTHAARLMMNGRVGDMDKRALVGDSLDFLRLVHISPTALSCAPPIRHTNGPVPAGWIWERVRGAQLIARGAPGETFATTIDVEYPWPSKANEAQRVLQWVAHATVGGDGFAHLRVPYCTDASNGDGVVRGLARWSVGARRGEVAIPARAVESGGRIEL